MPPDNASVLYLVTTAPGSVTLTLPPAASAAGRLVTVRRSDNGRWVTVKPSNNEAINGARRPIVLDDRYDSVTLATDGVEWVVLFRQE